MLEINFFLKKTDCLKSLQTVEYGPKKFLDVSLRHLTDVYANFFAGIIMDINQNNQAIEGLLPQNGFIDMKFCLNLIDQLEDSDFSISKPQISYFLLSRLSLDHHALIIPIDLLSLMHRHGILFINSYLLKIPPVRHVSVVRLISQGMWTLARAQVNHNDITLRNIFFILIPLAFCRRHRSNNVTNSSSLPLVIIDNFIRKFQEYICSDLNKDNKFPKIFGLLNVLPVSMDALTLKAFYSRVLGSLASHRRTIKAGRAIQEQASWKWLDNCGHLTDSFKELCAIFNTEELVDLLERILVREVNWKSLLVLVSLLADYVNDFDVRLTSCFIAKKCRDCFKEDNQEDLLTAVLLSRCIHASRIEAYQLWISSTFPPIIGDNRRYLKQFVDFLSRLVPFESVQMLRAHMNGGSTFLSGHTDMKQIWLDYVSLARTRITDLTLISSKTNNVVFDMKTSSTASFKEDARIEREVKDAIDSFDQNRKIPKLLTEMCLFRRSYFDGVFVPCLLKPLKTSVQDTKRNALIEVLVAKGKISKSRFDTYKEEYKMYMKQKRFKGLA